MSKYNVGDYIRIKTIDELLETYRNNIEKYKSIQEQTSFRSSSRILFTESMFSLCGKVYKVIDNDYPSGDIGIHVSDGKNPGYYCISPEWISREIRMDFDIDKEKILLMI